MRTFLIHKQKPFKTMKRELLKEIPSVYLSRNYEGWSLIKDGMPLCDVTSKEYAMKFADLCNIKLPSVYWQADDGQFVSI